MHLPLLDIPKPRRSCRPRCASASALVAACLAVSWLSTPHSQPLQSGTIVCDAPPTLPVPEAMSGPRVTVTTTKTFVSGGREYSFSAQEQVPLRVLYDELCEVEDKAEMEAETMEGRASNTFLEQISLRAEKQFMRKYSLTEKQVGMIQRDGYRMLHPQPLTGSSKE